MPFDSDKLNNLYKRLKAYEFDNNRNLVDSDYLDNNEYVSDIIIGGILDEAKNIIVNLEIDNVSSVGVDLDCKSLMEGLLLYLIYSNEMDDDQILMYRYQYSVSDFGDRNKYKHYLKTPYKYPSYVPRDSEILIECACRYFECTREELLKSGKLKEPYFYLSSSLHEDVSLKDFFQDYTLGFDNDLEAYNFFSRSFHPTLEIDQKVAEDINKVREVYISALLDSFESFLDNVMYPVDYESLSTIEGDLEEDKDYLKDVNKVSKFSLNYAKHIPDGWPVYINYYFNCMSSLMKDMLYSYSIGTTDNLVSKFYLVIEMSATLDFFIYNDSIKSYDDRAFREDALVLSSRYKLSNGTANLRFLSSHVSYIYQNYYKELYSPISEKEFKRNLKRCSIYSLSCEYLTYKDFIRTYLSETLVKGSKKITSLYNLSIDMSLREGNNYDYPSNYDKLATDSIGYALAFYDRYLHIVLDYLNDGRKQKLSYEKEFTIFENISIYLTGLAYQYNLIAKEKESLPTAEA